MYYGNTGWVGWLMMTVMMVLFWGVIIFGFVAAVRGFNGPRHSNSGPGISAAEQVLAARFARGDVTDEEYRQRLATLRDIHHGIG